MRRINASAALFIERGDLELAGTGLFVGGSISRQSGDQRVHRPRRQVMRQAKARQAALLAVAKANCAHASYCEEAYGLFLTSDKCGFRFCASEVSGLRFDLVWLRTTACFPNTHHVVVVVKAFLLTYIKLSSLPPVSQTL